MTCFLPPGSSTQSAPGLMVSATVFSGSSTSRIWSKYATCTLVPRRTRARVGRERAEDQAEERGLAGAVGADEAEAVAARDDEVEVFDDGSFAERLC